MPYAQSRRVTLPPVLALVLLAVPAAAQEAAAPAPSVAEPFVDRIDVHLANVEVLVTDADGNPVTGLSREDFEVREDGVPVEPTHFFEVRQGSAGIAATGAGAEFLPPEPATRNLLLVVYLDVLNLDPGSRNRALASLREFLRARLDEDDLVMLVTHDGRVRVVEPFTRDVARLEARIDEIERELGRAIGYTHERDQILRRLALAPLTSRPIGQAPDMGDFDYAEFEADRLHTAVRQNIDREIERVELSLNNLALFTASLAGLRGRKALVYVSQGLRERPGEALVRAWVDKYEGWAARNQSAQISRHVATAEMMPRSVGERLRALVRQASADRVAIYTLAPPERGGGFGSLSAAHRAVAGDGGPVGSSSAIDALDLMGRESSLLQISGGTGGLAYTRTDNLSGLLERVASDFTNFYSLGYTPRRPGDGEYHEVEVTVRDRPDLKVRHLAGYRERTPVDALRQATMSALRYAVDDNPLGLGVREGRHQATAGGQYRVPILLAVPFDRLALLPQDGRYVGKVVAFLAVEDDEGRMSPLQRIELPIEIPADRFEDAAGGSAGYEVDLVMRRGRHRVAVGLRDEVAGVESSLSFEVEVGEGRSGA